MSSWPPHLPIAMTASRAAPAARCLAPPAAGRRPAPRRGCRRRGRRARRPRRRRPGGGSGRGRPGGAARRRYSTRSASTASASGTVAAGDRVVRVGADGLEQALADGVRRRAGRAEGRVGELAPVLGVAAEVVGERLAGAEHATAAASPCPRRRRAPASSCSAAVRRSALGQPDQRGERQVGVGGAGEQREQRLGGVAERARGLLERLARVLRSRAGSGCPWWWWAGSRRSRRRRAGPRATSAKPAASGARRGRARPGRPRCRRAARRRRGRGRRARCARRRSPRARRSPRRPRGAAARPTSAGPNRAACTSPSGVCGEHDARRRAARRRVVVPLHAAARGGQAARRAGRRGRLGPADVEQPDLLAARVGRDPPPSAVPSSWWPRQMPSVGTSLRDGVPDQLLDRADPVEHLVVVGAHRAAEHQQPGVAVEGRAARRRRTGGGRRARSRPPASQRPNRCGGPSASCWTTRIFTIVASGSSGISARNEQGEADQREQEGEPGAGQTDPGEHAEHAR